MTVAQLIEALRAMPPAAEVAYIWDGEPRSSVECVWHSRGGDVILSDEGQSVYSDAARPIDAPSRKDLVVWQTPGDHQMP